LLHRQAPTVTCASRRWHSPGRPCSIVGHFPPSASTAPDRQEERHGSEEDQDPLHDSPQGYPCGNPRIRPQGGLAQAGREEGKGPAPEEDRDGDEAQESTEVRRI